MVQRTAVIAEMVNLLCQQQGAYPMKTSHKSSLGLIWLSALVCVPALNAAEIRKADNSNNLNLGSSWIGGVAPTGTDVARWDDAITSANTVALGADLSWAGIRMLVENPVTISSGNTLTLGAS